MSQGSGSGPGAPTRDAREPPPADAAPPSAAAPPAADPGTQGGLASTVEALLFLSSEPVGLDDLREACGCDDLDLEDAVAELRAAYAPGRRGLVLRDLAGGLQLSTAPDAEPAARRLLARPRTPALSPAQAETLAIVAYLQPVSRPEISRIRGVAAEATCATLHERGLIEEAGRSPHGAVQYRTSALFLRLFGLDGLADLPDTAAFDPTPEETDALRERLLRAGSARGGDEVAAREAAEGLAPEPLPAGPPAAGDPDAGPLPARAAPGGPSADAPPDSRPAADLPIQTDAPRPRPAPDP